jgi:hypothetical protein
MGRSGSLVVRPEQSKAGKGETAMRQNSVGKLSGAATRLTLATILAALSVLSAGYANPSNDIVLVPPTNLPTLARQNGEAMFLHDTKDGRIFLYVEQHQGTQLLIFDVTDPARVKGEGSVQLDASGPFDFVADLGKRGELVRFREGQGEAVLDLRNKPVLTKVQGLDTRDSTILLADYASRLTGQAFAPVAQGTRDYKIFQSGESPSDDRIIEVRQVRQDVTNPDTGTTFLLAENGLYLIRRPALEAAPEVFTSSGGL